MKMNIPYSLMNEMKLSAATTGAVACTVLVVLALGGKFLFGGGAEWSVMAVLAVVGQGWFVTVMWFTRGALTQPAVTTGSGKTTNTMDMLRAVAETEHDNRREVLSIEDPPRTNAVTDDYDQWSAWRIGRDCREKGYSLEDAVRRLEGVWSQAEQRRYFDAGFAGKPCPALTAPRAK